MIFYRKIYDLDNTVFNDMFDNPSKYDGYVCIINFDSGGVRRFYYNRQLHRKDYPAQEYVIDPWRRNSYWYMGKYHREDGPARLNDSEYYFHGERIWVDNDKEFKKKIKSFCLRRFIK